MNRPPKTFVEVCIYEVKPNKTEEFEQLIERVAQHHRDFVGVKDVRCMRAHKRVKGEGRFPLPDYQSFLHMVYNPVEHRFYKQVVVSVYARAGFVQHFCILLGSWLRMVCFGVHV